MKKVFPLLAILPAFLLVSCLKYEPVEFKGIQSMKITKLGADGLEAEFLIRIKNPNNFGFSITDYDLDIRMMQMKIGKAKLQKKVKIKANSEEGYPFQIKAKFGEMLMASLPLLLSMGSQKSTQVQTKGYVKVKHWGISKKIDVDLDEAIKLMQ